MAGESGVPVEIGTAVVGLERDGALYRVETDRGTWVAAAVVIATGYCDTPFVPSMVGLGALLVATSGANRGTAPSRSPAGAAPRSSAPQRAV